MLTSLVSRLIALCIRYHKAVVIAGLILGVAGTLYTARNFALNSDIGSLLSRDLPWRQREIAFEEAFRRYQLIAIVVEAPTPELTAAASKVLLNKLHVDTVHFQSVSDAGASQFFAHHSLLYLSFDELKSTLSELKRAEPLLQDVTTDPSLRGLVSMLEDVLLGVQQGKVGLDTLAPTIDRIATVAEAVVAAQQASFSWRVLFQGHPAKPSELRGFIEVRPKLDYASLEPGRAASDAIRIAAKPIENQFQARVRLTGPVALADDEFSKIKENALRNGLITGATVLLILWLALRSFRLIVAVVVNLAVGLSLTAAMGLLLVGTFNVISVSFAVLFVGIGVDFAIQYAVRYRAERYRLGDLQIALASAGRRVAAPLTLAALATAAGFLSFLPTNYKGVSELGVIAGLGMLIAFGSSVSLLPSLICLIGAPTEQRSLQLNALGPLDTWLMRRRIGVISVTAVVVIAGLPLLYWLRFDFDPMHLRDPTSEPVATYLDLASDPDSGVNSIEVLAPSLDAADSIAEKLRPLSEVSRVTTFSSFVPSEQPEKIAAIRAEAPSFADLFDPKNAQAAPSDTEIVEALREASGRLVEAAAGETGSGAAASQRLSRVLGQLASATPEIRARADEVFVAPIRQDIEDLKFALAAEPVLLSSLPDSLRASWLAADGRARVSVAPKAELSSATDIRRFVSAVLALEPRATEGPVAIYEAGRTIVRAFVEAGLWAFISIALILWLVLKRIDDVLLTLVPLILAGVVTMELCVLIGMPLNFANIIALPLLLGIGVAFKIYYITAWREGQVHLLQTALTRAVVFSAMTTATAFGSLWFSSHPGTSSMGKLLALSLISTLAAAVLFQPILMGPPRVPQAGGDAEAIKGLPVANIEKENSQ